MFPGRVGLLSPTGFEGTIDDRRHDELPHAGGEELRWGTQSTISAATGAASEIVRVTDDVHYRETGTDQAVENVPAVDREPRLRASISAAIGQK
ncbi:hypothetical protein MesoLjLb_32860 [Mesorhizobium sp. L-8-3]|nr:hypothetical protein MesoLjLb_32860 [Mesorhizobium sp. L-8-3]